MNDDDREKRQGMRPLWQFVNFNNNYLFGFKFRTRVGFQPLLAFEKETLFRAKTKIIIVDCKPIVSFAPVRVEK